MDTTVGLGLAQSFQHAGHLANECAEFQSLANGVMTKVMTGQCDEPSKDPDVLQGTTALKLLLARAERPNWVPCFVQSYQLGLTVMWQHYVALQKVLLKPLKEEEFKRNTCLVNPAAWNEIQTAARGLIQEHIQEAKDFWEALKKYQEKREREEQKN